MAEDLLLSNVHLGVDKFTGLANELKYDIFSYLTRKEILASISLLSHSFRAYTEKEFIYRNLRLEVGYPADGSSGTKVNGLSNLNQLFTTLLRRPEPDPLRSYITKILLKISPFSLYDEVCGHLRLLKELPKLYELSLNPPPLDFDLEINPGLESLRLDFYYDRFAFWVDEGRFFPELPRLNLAQYFWISTLPQLRKIQIEHISFISELHADRFSDRPARSSLIQDLRLIDCSPQKLGILPTILLSIKALKRFVLEMNCPWEVTQRSPGWQEYVGWNQNVNAEDFAAAMELHSESLEELVIAFSDGATFKRTSIIETLPTFSGLTRLAVPERFLVLLEGITFHDLLPTQLEELQLQYPMGPTTGDELAKIPSQIDRLQILAGSKSAYLPKLKYLCAWFQHWRYSGPGASDWYLHDLQMLATTFDDAEVNFEWLWAPDFKETPFGKRLGVSVPTCRTPEYLIDWSPLSRGAGLYLDESTHSIF
ncbi:hypothetical protein MMC28_006900 [Mycoblastus sanguinarius]|nr:hypothetical protein [Mycoblastus sanguinarius]